MTQDMKLSAEEIERLKERLRAKTVKTVIYPATNGFIPQDEMSYEIEKYENPDGIAALATIEQLERERDEIGREHNTATKEWAEAESQRDAALEALKAIGHNDTLRSSPEYEADPVEQLVFELSWELEEATLDAADFVTVNREKLRAIAKRVLARQALAQIDAITASNSPTEGDGK